VSDEVKYCGNASSLRDRVADVLGRGRIIAAKYTSTVKELQPQLLATISISYNYSLIATAATTSHCQ